jgi:hypothetical protein
LRVFADEGVHDTQRDHRTHNSPTPKHQRFVLSATRQTHHRLPNPVRIAPLTAVPTPSSSNTGHPIAVANAKKYIICGKWSVATCISWCPTSQKLISFGKEEH